MKIKFLSYLATLLFFTTIFYACKKDNGVYYSSVSLIINTSCAVNGCHNTNDKAGGLDCSSYAAMNSVLNNGKFNTRVLVQQDMPPSGTLSSADLELLQQWKDNGFREN